ncbi:YodC family protein [Erwinia billingiae]|uniref:YodC family protein n=1 Tax=Erwinia billingiae TaxID=182337 RepID=UPI003209FC2D
MSKKAEAGRTPKYKIGDIVFLVTGGPSMSVSDVNEWRDEFSGTYRCQWFAGKKLDSGAFPEESLTQTNPKP